MPLRRPRGRLATSTASKSMNDFVRGSSSSSRQQRESWNSYAQSPLDEPVTVHGGGVLRTWSFEYGSGAEVADVFIQSTGSPVDASVELWEGPNYAPVYMRTYSQDGGTHPLSLRLLLDESRSSSLALRNTGPNTFPLQAVVGRSNVDPSLANMLDRIGSGYEDDLQGGASLSYPIHSQVEQTQLLLRTEGRPLNVRVELMQGPNNNKVVAEVQSMDGTPMVLSFETPGYANVIRVINLSPLEFPIVALVDPAHIDQRSNQWGGESSMSLRGNTRRDRWSAGRGMGYNGSGGSFFGNESSPRGMGFRSSSMNRAADRISGGGNRVLASELNYAAPVQQDPYMSPINTSNRVLSNNINSNYSVASKLGRNYAAPVQQEPYTSQNNNRLVVVGTTSSDHKSKSSTGRFGSVADRPRNPLLNKNVPGSSNDLLARSPPSSSTSSAGDSGWWSS
jgi:hypothetical protein